MLTLITGTPGAGKTLLTVWEHCRKVPGSFLTDDKGEKVERRLHSNIKRLLVPHEHITAEDLNCWHTWAKPGDVIVFDEVQEVWRPRGKVSEVPECIAKLETHRHMGVDIILMTQNPMLMDSNIRRLVNRHIHLRRVSRTIAIVYEWDGCMDAPASRYSAAMSRRVFRHPKQAYELYKSAELHTKPVVKVPGLAFIGLAAVVGTVYAGPTFYSRLQERLEPAKPAQSKPAQFPQTTPLAAGAGAKPSGLPPAAPAPSSPVAAVAAAPVLMGCIALGPRCECFGTAGTRVQVEPEVCSEGSHRPAQLLASSSSTTKGYGASPHAEQAAPAESQVYIAGPARNATAR